MNGDIPKLATGGKTRLGLLLRKWRGSAAGLRDSRQEFCDRLEGWSAELEREYGIRISPASIRDIRSQADDEYADCLSVIEELERETDRRNPPSAAQPGRPTLRPVIAALALGAAIGALMLVVAFRVAH